MARKSSSLLLLVLTGILLVGLASADWNILNHRFRSTSSSSSSSSESALGGSSLKTYCESWRINVELNNIRNYEVVPEECVDYIKKYMKSSQYKADVQRAIEEVTLYISNCCSFKGDGKDAWIFDVDDTLLSTVPYYKKYGFGGKRNFTQLEAWMKKGKAPAIPQVQTLFSELRDKGVKIFLISSRSETLRSPTVDNLIDVGYHGWSKLFLRSLNDQFKEVKQYKTEVRKQLVNKGHRIWGIVGSQWSSIQGHPKAKRTFKLPNSMYYVA